MAGSCKRAWSRIQTGMEAEESVGVKRIEGSPASIPRQTLAGILNMLGILVIPIVGQLSASSISAHPLFLPLLDIGFADVAIVLRVICHTTDFRKFTHGLDADDAFECEIGHERKPTSEVIGAKLR